MSFLTRTAPRFTRSIAFAPRAFSTTFTPQKGPVDTVKGAAKTVDRAISDKLVDGIEIGEKVVGKTKEAIPETRGEAKGKASELAGEAKGKAHEVAGDVKGKANEAQGKL